MVKSIQKAVFLLVIIVFSNNVLAYDWPIFSTKDMGQPYIELDQLFNVETKFYDDVYRYDLDLNGPNIELLNVLMIMSNTSMIEFIPIDKTVQENTTTYTIYLNRVQISKIDIKRKK